MPTPRDTGMGKGVPADMPHTFKDPGPDDAPDLCQSCRRPIEEHEHRFVPYSDAFPTMCAFCRKFHEPQPIPPEEQCGNCGSHIKNHANWCTYNPKNIKSQADPVNHPSHYTAYKGLEVIDLTEQMNFNRGNAVKYICRAGIKDKDKEVEDLKKAAWYIDREIMRITGESSDDRKQHVYEESVKALQKYKEQHNK